MPNRLTRNLRTRARNWALRRQGTDALPLTLSSRRIYILPTRSGWIFALLIVAMFIAGMNYGNGLALLFAFWMAGFALVAMVQTQRILSGLRIISGSAGTAFAGANIDLSLATVARDAHADILLDMDSDDSASPGSTLPDNGGLRLQVAASRRGPWRAPPLRLTSTAPFGLFRTWTWLSPEISTLVYPRPDGMLPMPDAPGEDSGKGHLSSDQEELAWLREFREGDSPRQVAWKAYARGAPLLVREFRGQSRGSLDFDFSALPVADSEARLSQLARWCIDAAAADEPWTLRLPGAPPLSGQGQEHRELCLQRLALHGFRDPA